MIPLALANHDLIACAETGTVICMHIGSGSRLPNTSADAPNGVMLDTDAGLIGLRSEQGVFLQQSRGNASFTRDAWFVRWHVSGAAPQG